MTAVVHGLFVHPIKGCTATALTTSAVVETGLAHDRDFMLVDAVDGHFISQRKLPAMAVITPTVVDDGLVVTAPGLEDYEHKTRFDGDRLPVKVHWWDGQGVDQGDEAAEWFSEALGRACRFVRVPPDLDRGLEGEGKVGFADAHALLMTSLASLDGLNERILQRGAEPIPMNRFRPNVVVTGWPEPHTEDRVRGVTIGTASFGYARICVRCVVPTVDQDTGLKAGHEPTRTLADYRRAEGGVTFGMKAKVLHHGTLSVGDELHVTAWA